MRKYLALILAFVLCFALCACDKDQPVSSDPTGSSVSDPTNGESDPTDGATDPGHTHEYKQEVVAPDCLNAGYTNNTCECGDSYRSDEVAATGHSWENATCKTPKTCTVCKTTEGDPAAHNYQNGTCPDCGTADPSYKALTTGAWINYKAASSFMLGDGIAEQKLTFGSEKMWTWRFFGELETLEEEFMEDWIASGSLLQLDGKYYLWQGMADMCEITFTESGATVTVPTDPEGGFTITLQRISGNQLKVTAVEGEAASVFLPYLAVGDVFTWTE